MISELRCVIGIPNHGKRHPVLDVGVEMIILSLRNTFPISPIVTEMG